MKRLPLQQACCTLLAVAALACASPAREATPLAALNTPGEQAFAGYDLVAYFTDGRATPGEPRYAYRWRGSTYHFVSAAHRELFARAPERYLPQYGGYCAYAVAWNRSADVDPRYWSIVDGRLYLNNNALAQSLWRLRERGLIESADRNWRGFLLSPELTRSFGSLAFARAECAAVE